MVGIIGFVGVIAIGAPQFFRFRQLIGLQSTSSTEKSEDFRLAVNKAMSAAQLTQTAHYQEEWKKVELLWAEAAELMGAVPETSAQHTLAQEKVEEYERNQQYAYSNVISRPSGAPINNQLWTKGTTREFLLAVQGPPTEITRQDVLCRETYAYERSEVELQHGLVTRYNDRDSNLNASPDVENRSTTAKNANYWALGATKQDVLKVQGTPTRVRNYDALNTDIFYYENSLVELNEGIVVGYSNFDGNLKVNIDAMIPGVGHKAIVRDEIKSWSIGSTRSEVFSIQGTPVQVERSDHDCVETLHYQDSTVDLKNGIVQEYDNFSNNLRVRLTKPQ